MLIPNTADVLQHHRRKNVKNRQNFMEILMNTLTVMENIILFQINLLFLIMLFSFRNIDHSILYEIKIRLFLHKNFSINVELVAGDGCVKYVTKYVMKGADMAFIRVEQEGFEGGAWRYDEFHQLRLARYITSMEAFLSLWGTKLVVRSHIVIFIFFRILLNFEVDELDVHGPQGHYISFEEGQELETAEITQLRVDAGEERRTQLTAYFEFNRNRQLQGEVAAGLTYGNAYQQLRYDPQKKRWQFYVDPNRTQNKLCRIRTVSPTNIELLAIRVY